MPDPKPAAAPAPKPAAAAAPAAPAKPDVGAALDAFLQQQGLSRAELLQTLAPVGRGTVTHRPDAVRMDAYPLLVYGPTADPKVRVASTSVPVAEIIETRDKDPHGDLARRFRIAPEEVEEVLRWADDPQRPGA